MLITLPFCKVLAILFLLYLNDLPDNIISNMWQNLNHSDKKRKDSLKGSLDRVLFAAELEFPKILVPGLPKNSSNVNIEWAGKSVICKTTVFFVWPASWSIDISSFYHSDINLFLIDYACCKLCIWLLLFENNSGSYHCTGASHWRKSIVQVITQDRVIDGTLKKQSKKQTLYACRYSY